MTLSFAFIMTLKFYRFKALDPLRRRNIATRAEYTTLKTWRDAAADSGKAPNSFIQ
jgi:hypothetical protein